MLYSRLLAGKRKEGSSCAPALYFVLNDPAGTNSGPIC